MAEPWSGPPNRKQCSAQWFAGKMQRLASEDSRAHSFSYIDTHRHIDHPSSRVARRTEVPQSVVELPSAINI